MFCLATNATVTRDQFKILPMLDLVVAHTTSLAESQVYICGINPYVGPLEADNAAATLPDMITVDRRNRVVQLADQYAIAPAAGMYDDLRYLPAQRHDSGQN